VVGCVTMLLSVSVHVCLRVRCSVTAVVRWCMEEVAPARLLSFGRGDCVGAAAPAFRVPVTVCVQQGVTWGSMTHADDDADGDAAAVFGGPGS
jgi:hypothetical protein